jgi:uncharacterized protein YuzE
VARQRTSHLGQRLARRAKVGSENVSARGKEALIQYLDFKGVPELVQIGGDDVTLEMDHDGGVIGLSIFWERWYLALAAQSGPSLPLLSRYGFSADRFDSLLACNKMSVSIIAAALADI